VLGQCAENAGVTRLTPATVLRVDRLDTHQEVTLSLPDGQCIVRAQWVLDCSGRAGLLSRAYRVAPAATVRTIALVGIWERNDAWPLPDDTHTLVESTEWGWGWSVPLSPSTRCFTAMVDPYATPLVGEDGLVSRYDALFAALPALGPILRGARRTVAPWACEATPYHSHEVALPRTLFVGDAASMIDPLSSFGVKKALASAWLAAVVVHTALVTPEHEESAKGLYREREAAYVRSAALALRGVSRSAEGGREAPFWSVRVDQQATEAGEESELITRLRTDPSVLQAFADLRDRPTVRLEADPLLPRVQRPVVRGNVVVPATHVLLHGEREPLRYLRSIDCVELLEVTASSDDVGAMYTHYARRAGPVPLPDFLGALSVLVAKGALRLA
jgi:hypothetical protein